jgi:hypothetical protein
VRFGLAPIEGADLPGICRALSLTAVEIEAGVLERQLGVPGLPQAIAPAADDGFETGMLPLEEEILQDEIELAERTIAARRREWRRDVALSPLETWRSSLPPEVDRVLVRWERLADLADDEIGFAMRLARAVGAGTLVTGFSERGVQRLVPATEAAGLRIAFEPRRRWWADDVAAALQASPTADLSLPIDDAMAAARAAAITGLLEHQAARVAHVAVSFDARAESAVAASEGTSVSSSCDLLRRLRAQEKTLAVMVVLSCDGDQEHQPAFVPAAAAALADCRTCLGL